MKHTRPCASFLPLLPSSPSGRFLSSFSAGHGCSPCWKQGHGAGGWSCCTPAVPPLLHCAPAWSKAPTPATAEGLSGSCNNELCSQRARISCPNTNPEQKELQEVCCSPSLVVQGALAPLAAQMSHAQPRLLVLSPPSSASTPWVLGAAPAQDPGAKGQQVLENSRSRSQFCCSLQSTWQGTKCEGMLPRCGRSRARRAGRAGAAARCKAGFVSPPGDFLTGR